MNSQNTNPEALKMKPSTAESVDNLIAKKRAEKEMKGASEVKQHAEGIQGEVIDVIGGVEKPSDKISEVKGETGEKGDISSGGQQSSSDDAVQIKQDLQSIVLPTEEVMIKKIRTAITIQIKDELKRAVKFKGSISTGGAEDYNNSIARIRKLKEVLALLFTNTFEFVKGLYFKYFIQDGKRKALKDVE